MFSRLDHSLQRENLEATAAASRSEDSIDTKVSARTRGWGYEEACCCLSANPAASERAVWPDVK
jgi:hypothetical protein